MKTLLTAMLFGSLYATMPAPTTQAGAGVPRGVITIPQEGGVRCRIEVNGPTAVLRLDGCIDPRLEGFDNPASD